MREDYPSLVLEVTRSDLPLEVQRTKLRELIPDDDVLVDVLHALLFATARAKRSRGGEAS